MGTIFMWLKKSQSPKIFVAVPQASHFLTFNHLFAIIFSSAKDVVYINYTGRILRKRPAFWSPLPLYLSFLYGGYTLNKDRMVHIYAAQYFLVTSYWRCPTDRVWSKFLSLIHCKVYNDNCLLNNFAVFKLRLKWLTLHKRGHYHRNNCCKQTLYSWLNPPFQNLRFILSGRW